LVRQKSKYKWDENNVSCPICSSKALKKGRHIYGCSKNPKHKFKTQELAQMIELTDLNSDCFHKWIVKDDEIFEIFRNKKN